MPGEVVLDSVCRNFSKPASPIIAQMFNFLNLGFEGYRRIAQKDLRNARFLSRALDQTYFTVLSNVHIPVKGDALNDRAGDSPESYEAGLPVVAFRLVFFRIIHKPGPLWFSFLGFRIGL